MGKEKEPSIITEAKGRITQNLELSKANNRLKDMVASHGEYRHLGGKGSAVVERKIVYGQVAETSFFVQVRGLHGFSMNDFALCFSSGDFHRSYVFQGFMSTVFDTHLDENKVKGAWIGIPDSSSRRMLTQADTVQLNEAMDLFEQNVGRGVNRD